MAQQQSFNIGDIVKLKSGGPDMTVQAATEWQGKVSYKCQWFAGKKLEGGAFPADSIELANAG